MTVITLLRHGEPAPDAQGTHYGDADVALSDRGREQSIAVAASLAAETFDAVWSSNLSRAGFLAEQLAVPRNLAVQVDPALRERGVGILQGMTWAEADAAHPELTRAMREDPAGHRLPGGENLTDLAARVLPALDRILAAHQGQRIAVACHGGPIRVVLGHALGLPLSRAERIVLDYCRVSQVEFRADGRIRVARVNA